MIVLFHKGGPAPCGGPALGVIKPQVAYYELPADNVLKLDGTPPKRGDLMFCGTCNEPIHPQFLSR